MGAQQSQGELSGPGSGPGAVPPDLAAALAASGLHPSSSEFAALKAALQATRSGGTPAAASGGAPAPGGGAAEDAAPGRSGAAAPPGPSEAAVTDTDLLQQLVHALTKRVGYSLLLSDLGVLLPKEHRQWVKERGGLRSWLQRHPGLFRVAGQPGKESVTLMFDVAGGARQDAEAAAEPGKATDSAAHVQAEHDTSAETEQRRQEDEENESAVQLRGLPYRASVDDIKNFLGPHVQFLKEARPGHAAPVQLVLNRDGRPSGFAKVQFTAPAAAKAARNALHNQKMDVSTSGSEPQSRYVEIFLFSERPNKLRFKRAAESVPLASEEEDPGSEEQRRTLAAQKQRAYEECRVYMESPGKGELLLSMLGVALSSESRLYLKRTDQGLKHFLSQFPDDFSVEGAKGRENVYYLPVARPPPRAPAAALEDAPGLPPPPGRRPAGASGEGPPVPASPRVMTTDAMVDAFHHGTPKGAAGATVGACMRTPSDWGTPQYAPSPWDRAGAAGRAGKPHPGGGSGEAAAVAGVGRHGPQQPTADGTMPWAYQHAFGDLDAALGAWSGWGHEPTGMPPALGASWPGTLGGLGTPMPPWAVAQAVAAQMDAPQQVPPPWQAQADSSAVLLRGLPPDATEQDVFVFFAMHNMADLIEEGQGKVRMLAKSGSKTSGEAVVWMQSYSHACVALMELNGQALKAKDSAGGARTIEVLHYEELVAPQAAWCAPASGSSAPPGGGSFHMPAPPKLGDMPEWLLNAKPAGMRHGPPRGLEQPPPAGRSGAAGGPGNPNQEEVASWDALLHLVERTAEGGRGAAPAAGAPPRWPRGPLPQPGGALRVDSA